MPLETRRANLSDAAAIASIFTAARYPNILEQDTYPDGLSDADQQARVDIFRADLQDSSRTFYIVEDIGVETVDRIHVSFMEWRTGTVQSMNDGDAQRASAGSLYMKKRRNESIAKLADDTKRGWETYMGDKEHIRLEALYTLPSHNRRGIASSLLESLKQHADEQGLPIFMEAIPVAKELYLRHGFVALKEYTAYIPQQGGQEGLQPYSNWHMLREPVRTERGVQTSP